MKRFYLLIIFLIFLNITSPALGYTLEGSVVYNVDMARKISFENVRSFIDIEPYHTFLKDENYSINQKLITKNRSRFKNRIITSFSDGGYSIRYKNIDNPCYYFDKNGNLIALGFVDGVNYPKKYLTYSVKGKLIDITLYVSGIEQFIFSVDKKLQAHWIGDNCYDENGALIMTRN